MWLDKVIGHRDREVDQMSDSISEEERTSLAEGLDIRAQAGGLRRAICTLAAGPLGTSTPSPREYSSQLSGKSFASLFLHQQVEELGLRKTEPLAGSSAVDQENPGPNPGHYKQECLLGSSPKKEESLPDFRTQIGFPNLSSGLHHCASSAEPQKVSFLENMGALFPAKRVESQTSSGL